MNPLKKIAPMLLAVLCSQVCAEITASEAASHSSSSEPESTPPASTSAPPVIPLDTVSDYIGKTVTIVDTVKGVSSSPRSGTLYLNFGDAYPRQRLSTKIAKDLEDLRKTARRTLGLQVRVTGVVESDKDGPAMTLVSSDQLQIIKNDSMELPDVIASATGYSSKPPGPHDNIPREGEAYGQLLSWKLQKLFNEGKYEELEKIAAAWRKPEARMLDGRWNLFVFYNALGPSSQSTEEEFAGARRKMEEWKKQRPQAIEPVIMLADLEASYAWHARGSGWADRVTEKGWRLMGERLAKAKSLLDSVYDRRLECPKWANTMQTVALGQGWPDKKVKSMLAEATAAWPEYWNYYFAEAQRLLPRWGGAPGEWEKYSRSFPGDFGKELSARIPWSVQWAHWNIFRDADIPWLQMKEGFEYMVKRYPDSTRTKSIFAVYAGMAGDRETCKRLLDELGDKVDMEFWISWQNVDIARQWIADTNRPPPILFRLTGPPPKGGSNP